MSRPEVSEHANHDTAQSPKSLTGKKTACDRCRGQKLRCIWDDDAAQCRRCVRAKAACTVAPPRPMGRPPKRTRSLHSHHAQPPVTRNPGNLSNMDIDHGAEAADGPETPVLETSIQEAAHSLLFDPVISDFISNPSAVNIFDANHFLYSPSTLFRDVNGPSGTSSGLSLSLDPALDGPLNASCRSSSDPATESTLIEPLAVMDQLSRMNMALYEHISQLNTINTSGSLNIGRLLSITHEFRALADRLGLPLPGASDKSFASAPLPCDQSTGLLLLSCYLRLKQAHGRTLVLLQEMEQLLEKKPVDDRGPEVLPDLVVDGFALAGHAGLQLRIMKQLCEGTFGIIGSIPVLDGNTATIMDWASLGHCLARLRELK